MTPPHITDSDLVHMMDLVWTSHTDKQQPHRQHLSWKRNAVACFGCCFTADLTSTYMFRAIFDCYGNTLTCFSPTAKLAMASLAQNSSDPVQLQQVPEKVPEGSGGFRRVPVQMADEIPEGSGADG